MSITTHALRFALTAAALAAAAATAEAKPRRVVVLDFDGPRSVADASRTKIVSVLGEQYDVVATKRWEEARAKYGRNQNGPGTWQKAAKESTVDAVIEGWVDDEGSYKLLTVQVREARSGSEIDNFSLKLGKSGLTEDTTNKLRTQLDDLLDWVEPGIDTPALPTYDATGVKSLRASKRGAVAKSAEPGSEEGKAIIEFEDPEDEEVADDRRVTRKAPPVSTAALPGDREESDNRDLKNIFGEGSVEADTVLGVSSKHVPVPTKRFFLEGGAYYSSRTLAADSDDPQNYSGIGSKGLILRASVYPFPQKKRDSVASGLGFSGKIWKSPASKTVAEVDSDSVGDFPFDYGGWEAAVHYRQPLGTLFAIDGEVGYGSEHYEFEEDFPLDVPNTKYGSFHVGGHIDLNVARGATVGVGAAYHYVTTQGMMTSLDWYGPGDTSGLNLDANFVIPLPKNLYIRGEINFRRYSTEFSAPDLSAEEALSADDSTVNGSAALGVAF